MDGLDGGDGLASCRCLKTHQTRAQPVSHIPIAFGRAAVSTVQYNHRAARRVATLTIALAVFLFTSTTWRHCTCGLRKLRGLAWF